MSMPHPTATAGPTALSCTPYRLHFRPAAHLGTMRWLVGAGMLSLGFFLWGLLTMTHPGYAPLYWLLLISLTYKLLWILHEWVHYVQVSEPVPPPVAPRPRTVDFLTTACPGEPREMIIRTLTAMQAVRYPHTSYLCDEGDDPLLRAACARLGVTHVTRAVKMDAKAGNINHALRQATGELCVVLDPDHVPAPDFLDHVLPYFEDEQVGFVQVVQAYGNQQESLVARGAAEQTYYFYGPLMMGMNAAGTVQAIGANCTFRRAALDSIGGHAPGLTEDMHTAMLLHAAGWRSAYVPRVVSRGLAPASLAAFYAQQLKWARGSFDLLFRVYPRVCRRFTWAQRLHYFLLPLYFLSGLITLIDLALPLLSLGLSQSSLIVRISDLLIYTLPLLGMVLLVRSQVQRWLREPHEGGLHLAGSLLQLGTWWVYTLGLVYAVLNVRVPYLPTPKVGRRGNEGLLALPNLLLAGLLLAACKYGRVVSYSYYTNQMVALALANVALLVAAAALGQHEALRNVVRDMASRPFRWLVLGLHRQLAAIARNLGTGLRRFGHATALTGLVATGICYYCRTQWLARLPPEWLLTGAGTVHLGQIAGLAPNALASISAGWRPVAVTSDSHYTITALAITPSAPLPPLVRELAHHRQVPLLHWTDDALATMRPHYWQQLAQQLARLRGPVLLRPQLRAATAPAARRAWRHMVQAFGEAHVVNAVWVWTPEATDSLLERFPGVAYCQWLAGPLVANANEPGYSSLRGRLAHAQTLQQLPVLLLAPATTGTPQQLANRLSAQYPEVKAVVFTPAQSGMPPKTSLAGPGRLRHPVFLPLLATGLEHYKAK